MAAAAERPAARIAAAPAYLPDLDAYGLTLDAAGNVVAAVACPDRPAAQILSDPSAIVDARLWEGRFQHGRLRESRVTDRLGREQIGERYRRLRETAKISEADWFSMGVYQGGYGQPEGPLTSNYVPLIPGPATRQAYWADYWAASAKTFEASTHSGIAKRACRAMVQFPLGRGVRWQVSDDKALTAWEAFWKANRMRRRLRSIMYDLAVFGEQFLRYFPARPGTEGLLIVRQLDPATIYEIVTDQEDLETVFFYHQQFQTRMELYSPPAGKYAPEGRTQSGVTRYIIRQIDASEIDHWKVNDVSGEARGRSDLFPALGDLKRIRDLMTSKVIQADVGTRVLAILKAKGTAADIARLLGQIFPGGQPPPPGTIVGLNDAATLEPFQYTGAREVKADFTYDELVDQISAATGIARPYLGLSPAQGSGTTQASAASTVEPSVQTFSERQDICDELLHEMFDRVMAAAGINGMVEREFVFPEIASEDSQIKLDLVEQAEADGYISKRRAATTAAAELDFTDYDFDEEMREIVSEFADAQETDGPASSGLLGPDGLPVSKPAQGEKIRRPVIRATSRQVPKLDPTRSQAGDDEPPGLLVGAPGAAPAAGTPGMPAAAPAPKPQKNPASKAGRKTIARQTREAADGQVRRRSDDPEFAQHASEFEAQTAENLRMLLAEIRA